MDRLMAAVSLCYRASLIQRYGATTSAPIPIGAFWRTNNVSRFVPGHGSVRWPVRDPDVGMTWLPVAEGP